MARYTYIRPKKPLPVLAVILLDTLLFLGAVAVFCYFHHIRDLWGIGKSESSTGMQGIPLESTPPAETDAPPAGENAPTFDFGDFGTSFPTVFLWKGEPVLLESDTGIRTYLETANLPTLAGIQRDSSRYLGLYHSDSIFLTAEEVGVHLGTHHVTYYLYDVYVKNIENFFTVAVDEKVKMNAIQPFSYRITGTDGRPYLTYPAVLAMGGDFWGNANMTLFALRNGEILRDSRTIATDICVLYQNGVMEVISAQNFDYSSIMDKEPWQIWEFGPALMDNSGNVADTAHAAYFNEGFTESRQPRASLGYFEPGHYCFILADGRSVQSDGIRLSQLAEIYRQLGCLTSYNLDGGDSAQSVFNGKEHRIDEERAGNGQGQRELFDIIGIGEVVPE